MVNNTLAKALTLLKAELGANLTIGTSDDSRYYSMLESQQEWFASMYDWNQLYDKWDVTVVGGSAGRYSSFPSVDYNGNTYSINFDRPVIAYVKYTIRWQEMVYGIGIMEYNVRNSELTTPATQDPLMKWRYKPGDNSKFEVWPLGASASQTMRFEGQRKLTSLRTVGDVIDPTKTLDLDDRLLVLSVAINVLTAKEDPSVKVKSDKLNALWQVLRASESKQNRSFPLGETHKTNTRRVVPITVAG
jgi:hypothetical protein